jgi:beta-lactamase class A
MLSRRRFVARAGASLAGLGAGGLAAMGRAMAGPVTDLSAAFAAIEARSDARLGVAMIDAATGARSGHRADERFPMCSTFKFLAAAGVLARVDAGKDRLDRRIGIEARDLFDYAPAAKLHVGQGMTLDELCEAAVTLSDNTAGNLILATLGGPAGLTRFARSIGDKVTRLDRGEPQVNDSEPGDPRDTTAPAAMAADLNALVLGRALSPTSRERLTGWLVGCKTGGARIRAGLPNGWRVGDKTGTGAHGSTNDIGILWPPGRPPVILAVYLTGGTARDKDRSAAIAAVAQAVAAPFVP